MLYFMVTTSLKNVIKSDKVSFYISIRVGDAVAYSCLCCKVHNNLWLILGEEVFDKLFVGNVALYKSKEGVLLQLFQAVFLETYIVVVVHVVYSNYSMIGMCLGVFLHKVGAYESSGTSY